MVIHLLFCVRSACVLFGNRCEFGTVAVVGVRILLTAVRGGEAVG